MEKFDTDSNWNKKIQKLRRNFAELRGEDLRYVEGQEQKLVKRIGKRLRISERGAQELLGTA